jgi:hypothetical protein
VNDKVDEVVYAIWDYAWGEHWFLYELGEADDGFYCRCVDAYSWETLALGLGDSPTGAQTRAFGELATLAGRKPPGDR